MRLSQLIKHKVFKAGSWYIVTDFFLKGISFLTIPIFTRLLTPGEYGIVSIYLTWVSIFTIIMTLNLKESLTVAKSDYKDQYNQFASSTMFLSFLIFLGFLPLMIIFDDFLIQITGLTSLLFYLMIIQSYFVFVNDFAITKLRFEYKYKAVSIINIVITILGVLLSIAFIMYLFEGESYLGRVIGNMLFVVLIGIVLFNYIIKEGKKLINIQYWKYSLTFSLPLILHSLSGIVNAQFDRILINKFIGDSATGIYSFAFNIAMIISIIRASLDQAWTPWSFEKLSEGNFEVLKKRAYSYRNLFTFIYAVLLFLSPEIIKLMADQAYWDGIRLIPWMFIAFYFGFMTSFEVKIERFYKRTGLISLGTFLAACINIILNYIYIPIYGYMAAAITTAITFLLVFIFHFFITTKIMKKNIYGFKFHLVSMLQVVSVTGVFILFQDQLLLRIVCIVILFLIFYKSIRKFLKNKT